MARRRRMRKSDLASLMKGLVFIAFLGFIGNIFKLIGNINWMPLLAVSFSMILVFKLISALIEQRKKQNKRNFLLKKYQNIELVNKIIDGYFWVGQSEEQLIDSIGKPIDIDRKILVTKIKEVWKYDEIGKNRFALRITLDNGFVVGWDKK